MSHRFDYFGTTLKENFTSQKVNFKQLKKNRAEILNIRRETSKMWEDYKLIASESEKDIVDRVDANMQEVDQMVDMLIELADRDPNYVDSVVKNGILFNKIDPILEDINYLTDLQTEKGTEQTNIMLKLLSMFSSFMIGALALAIIMLGSVVYPMVKKEPEPKRKVRAPAKKPVAKKPAAKKPTTRKPVSKK